MRISDFKELYPTFSASLRKMNDLNLEYHIKACNDQKIQFSDQKNVVDFIEERLEKTKNEISIRARRGQKKELVKARLKRIEKKDRDIPKKVIITIQQETKNCPYCQRPIENGNIDHIYPLTLGGLSIPQNLVHCCENCNNKKGALTLIEFVDKYNLEWDRIKLRLKELNKRF